MQKLLRAIMLVTSFALAAPAFAAEHGTKEEAVALAKKVVAYIKANGKEKAIADVNSQKMFIDRDLYVAIGNSHGLVYAHGGNPKMAGKDLSEMKDIDGKPFIKIGSEAMKSSNSGWVDYKFPNPMTKKIESKSMYSERVGVDDLVVSVGVYKD